MSAFPEKKRYESKWFKVISVTRGWVGVKFPGKKRYVTLEWPLMFPLTGKAVSDIGGAASPVKSKMATMIAEQFVQLQLKIMQSLKNAIFCVVQHGHQ